MRHPEGGNLLMYPRQAVGLWLTRLGARITKLGDRLGGWEDVEGLPFRMGVQLGRQQGRVQGMRAARRNLPDEW